LFSSFIALFARCHSSGSLPHLHAASRLPPGSHRCPEQPHRCRMRVTAGGSVRQIPFFVPARLLARGGCSAAQGRARRAVPCPRGCAVPAGLYPHGFVPAGRCGAPGAVQPRADGSAASKAVISCALQPGSAAPALCPPACACANRPLLSGGEWWLAAKNCCLVSIQIQVRAHEWRRPAAARAAGAQCGAVREAPQLGAGFNAVSDTAGSFWSALPFLGTSSGDNRPLGNFLNLLRRFPYSGTSPIRF